MQGRIRPAGESSDEDEFADYMSDDNKAPALRNHWEPNKEERENERIFQLFMNGNLNEIRQILSEGYDVTKRLRDDWTPLLLSASVGASDITAELIAKGADVNMHRDYYTPLMAVACCPQTTAPLENSLIIAQQLISHNANVNAKTRKRKTALMYAASTGNYEIVKELLPVCDKMAEDNQGWTALFWAVSGNNADIVKLLLDEGLPHDKFDVRGKLPMHYAKENDYSDIVALLPSLKEDEKVFVSSEYGFQDFFDTGRSHFIQDVSTMLYGMKNEKNFEKFLNNGINLLKFLTLDGEDLLNIGITMPYERYRIINGLYRFHKHPFKTKALPIIGKTEDYSTLNVANTILSACRQFVVMEASLKYVLKNISDLHDLQAFENHISKIKDTISKISNIISKINEKAIEWDRETSPADVITANTRMKLRRSKLKYFYVISIISVSIFVTWKFY